MNTPFETTPGWDEMWKHHEHFSGGGSRVEIAVYADQHFEIMLETWGMGRVSMISCGFSTGANTPSSTHLSPTPKTQCEHLFTLRFLIPAYPIPH